MNQNDENGKWSMRWGVVIPPLLIFGFIIAMGIINEKLFVDTLWKLFKWLMTNFGWALDLGCLAFVIFSAVLLVHPIGHIKFGGKDAKPEFSTFTWWSISLCAGMGTGIVFWPPEALTHALKPARGMFLEPGSHQAIIWGMSQTFLHWTFTPYAIYVVCGVLIAFSYYNLKKPFAVSSALYPLVGDKIFGKPATFIDSLMLFAITGGVAGSLGVGLMQLGRGLEFFDIGIKSGPVVWTIICVMIVACYTTSSATGLHRGIQWLSHKNAWLFIIMLIFAFVFGPKAFTLNLSTQTAGYYVTHFFQSMTFTDPFPGGDMWPQWWDMFFFCDWLSFAPITGMFLARLCYGRTIREFLAINLVLPALFCMAWMGVFGSLTIHAQFVQGVDLGALMESKGLEVIMLKLFDFLPLANILRPLMMLTIFISFVTLADSMTSTVSWLSITKGKGYKGQEAPLSLKLFWGILMGATSLIFIFCGGLDGVKVVKTMTGVPILITEVCMMVGFIIYAVKHKLGLQGREELMERAAAEKKKRNPAVLENFEPSLCASESVTK
jgi:choline-glycine betaine transporter